MFRFTDKSNEIYLAVKELMELFDGSFINSHYELILTPKTNLYFCLENIETLLDLRCKVVAWCSRHACKTLPYSTRCNWRNEKYQTEVREKINKFLKVDFSEEDWMFIYTYLGNDIRRGLCEKFIESGYNLSVIREACEKK